MPGNAEHASLDRGPRRPAGVVGRRSALHDVLVRVAAHELARRRWQLGSIAGPECDDLAEQAADDSLMSILRRLDEFRGLSRFTTWRTSS